MMGNQPIFILSEDSTRTHGKDAKSNNIAAAKAVADAVRSTLGPKGMDKMLVDSMGDVVITNDGNTILKELDIEHPAAKMVVEVSKTQDQECGDGTTTAVVLSGELLKKAEELVEHNVHPTIITNGFRLAAEEASRILESIATPVTMDDRATLVKICSTTMTGKSVDAHKEYLSEIVVEAVSRVAEKKGKSVVVDTDDIKIEKKHGASLADSELIDGIIIDKEPVHASMPRTVRNAEVALVRSALEVKKTEVDAKIQIRDPAQMQAFLAEEERTLRGLADSLADTGATVVICEKGIDDLVQHFLAKKGILAIRRAKKSDMEKLAKATGAKLVTKVNEITSRDLGKAELVEVKKIGDDEMTFVTGCSSAKAVSILIRGGTEHVIEDAERTIKDAIGVARVSLEDQKMLAGGGAPETEIALRMRTFAATIGGKEQLAIDAFADAVEVIPRALAENSGLDPIDSLMALRNAHSSRKASGRYFGLDVYDGKVKNMMDMNVIEPLRVKTQAISAATEVASMILRIDDVISAKSGAGGAGMPPGGEMDY